MNRIDLTFLKKLYLFRDMPDEQILRAAEEFPGRTVTFAKGERIASPDDVCRRIGFLVRGECSVGHPRGEDDLLPMPMNTLRPSDAFGVMTVFAKNERFPSVIVAKTEAEILFYTEEEMLSLMTKYPSAAIATARFLAGRIAFLNRKIDNFSGRCCEEKLSSFLLSEYEKKGDRFAFSALAAARQLNIGRASLYRALDHMKEEGILSFENRTVCIVNPEKLRKNKKGN